ncbi:PhoD-like phosphatase [Seiridium cupressi]
MYGSARVLVAGALLTPIVSALFDGNLNYESPSKRHVNLGIDVPKVSRRAFKRDSVAYQPDELNFTHGVASGDPWPESVILWTRVAPSLNSDTSNVTVEGTVDLYNHETEKYIKASVNPICVEWKVFQSSDAKYPTNSTSVVSQGQAYTTSDIDYTVKVEADGLQPFTTYTYQFNICGTNITSPIGRTKTSPAKDADVSELKFAVFSCSNYPNGYFNVYGNAARKDEHDYVIHLGDYIYENAAQGERAHNPPNLLFSLWDYRTLADKAKYRTDPDLLLLTQNFAWIPTWDDHEVANNGYRDGFSALNNTEESFRNDGPGISVDQRKMNAVRAYFEWIPIRQIDLDDNLRVWRTFQMGKLADLIILDTRNYDRSITSLDWNDEYIDLIHDDASRSLMGSHQEHWFYNQLTASSERGATWRVVGDQIIFSRIRESFGWNGDNWNGYAANRNRTLKHLYDNEIGNNLFLAGDSHQNWVSDLAWVGTEAYDNGTGTGAIGVEFAGTAVTSSGASGDILTTRASAQARINDEWNSELQWQDGYYRGYFLLSLTPDKATAQFYGSPSVASRNPWNLPLANFTVLAGDNRLSRPVAGGSVEAGALRGGQTVPTNLTLNTETGEWEVIGFPKMYITT